MALHNTLGKSLLRFRIYLVKLIVSLILNHIEHSAHRNSNRFDLFSIWLFFYVSIPMFLMLLCGSILNWVKCLPHFLKAISLHYTLCTWQDLQFYPVIKKEKYEIQKRLCYDLDVCFLHFL